MNPQTQPDEKAGHESAANLAFATSLSQMLQGTHPSQTGQPMDGSQGPQNAPGEAEPQGPKDSPEEEKGEDMGEKMKEMELSMTQKLDDIRREMKDDQQRELDTLKQTIKDALKE